MNPFRVYQFTLFYMFAAYILVTLSFESSLNRKYTNLNKTNLYVFSTLHNLYGICTYSYSEIKLQIYVES
jgi:hypothetical protein